MSELFSHAISIVLIVLVALFWVVMVKHYIANKFAPVKSVRAEVIEKYTMNPVSHIPGPWNRKRYVVVFQAKGKKLSFEVAESSYETYRPKDKGVLKYQGKRLFKFQ